MVSEVNIQTTPAARRRLGGGFSLALASAWLLAWTVTQAETGQWGTVVDSPEGMDVTVNIATIVNKWGHSLQIFRDPNDIVRGVFTLKESFDLLDEASCPTLRVDGRRPRALVNLDGPCDVEANKARFTLGVIDEGRMESRLVFRLMNGGDLRFWFHVKDVGYRETVFTLNNSLQALTEALGTEVQVFTP